MKKLLRPHLPLRCVILTYLLLFAVATNANGKGVSSSGTDFWVAFMPNLQGGRIVTQLFIASETSNTVKVTVSGVTRTYALLANASITVDLIGAGVTSVPETPSDLGVHVASTAPITMYGLDSWDGGAGFLGASEDGFLALPTPALGTKYYSVNYFDASFSGVPTVGEYIVVATQDSTTVNFTTKGHTRGSNGITLQNPNETWSTMLMKGQTYLVQSTGNYLGLEDFTGSLITSNKPIALLSGHQCTPIDLTTQSGDHLLEMIPPVDEWGTQYFDLPISGRTRCGDYLRVLSGEDGNEIRMNGRSPIFLNAGDWAEIPMVLEPLMLTSITHKKFLTVMYSYSQGYNGDPGTADPFMIVMTPREQFLKRMLLRSPLPTKSGSFTNYLTIICQHDSINTIQLNGRSIASYGATVRTFLGTTSEMAIARVSLPPSATSYLATANVPFGMYQYGFSAYEGYGWPSGSGLNFVSSDSLPPAQVTIVNCGNYIVKLREVRHSPQYSFEDTRIASVDLITQPNDPRWAQPTFNYAYSPDPSFIPGDSMTSFTLSVIDPTKDAYAAIFTSDRAGNDTIYQYSYNAPKFTVTPDANYDFVAVVAMDTCRRVTIKNAQLSGSLDLTNLHLAGRATAGKFSFAPSSPKSLNPGDSAVVTVCYSPNDTSISFDTLSFNSSCSQQHLPLQGLGVTPLIDAQDVDFGIVDSGTTKCLKLRISNPGKATLTITQDQLPSTPDFSVTPPFGYPIILKPGDSITLNACFHPTHSGKFLVIDHFVTTNSAKFAHSTKDSALLSGRTSNAEVALAISSGFAIGMPVPNPFHATTSLRISFKRSAKITITIVSELGIEQVLLRDRTLGSGDHSLPIDLSNVSAGAYAIRVFINGQFTGSRKIVKLTK